MLTDISEVRGVFIHESIFGVAHDWGVIAATLKQYGINAVFANFIGHADGIRPNQEWVAAIAAFHAQGIEFHPSMNVVGDIASSSETAAVNSAGETANWNCPIKVRDTVKNTIETVCSTYDIDGLMLDYNRYPTGMTLCYCPVCKAAFEQWLGEGTISDWTPFYPDGDRISEYFEWRTIPVTELARDIRIWAHAIKPNLLISLCPWSLFSNNSTYWRYWIGQDSAAWVKEGYVGFVAPMMYTKTILGSTGETLESFINTNSQYMTGGIHGKVPLLAFLRNEWPDPSMTPAEFKAQVDYVRSRGLSGWIIWTYGGPGTTGYSVTDITPFLAALDMPDTFKISNLQWNLTGSGIEVTWETDKPTTSKVEYNTNPLFTATWSETGGFHYWLIEHHEGTIIEDTTPKTEHSILIPTGATPAGATVYFRVQNQAGNQTVMSSVHYTGEAPPSENVTPFLAELEEGVYEISLPAIITDQSNTYNFKQWEDGNTSPTRTVNLTSDISLLAIYELATPEIATIKGRVIDINDKLMSDVDVKCNGLQTKTLQDGSYVFSELEPNEYTIIASKAGYQTVTLMVDASAGGTITLPDIKLTSTPIVSSVGPLTIGAILIIGSAYL